MAGGLTESGSLRFMMKPPGYLKVIIAAVSIFLFPQITVAVTPIRTTKGATQSAPNHGVTGTGPEFQEAKTKSACGFYIWDVVSAVKYHWCMHLLKDNLYEGRGGKMFVRIRPGSILEALYPLSRHSPDRCLFCGASFQDHLVKWWEPKINSPYDSHLNMMHTNGVSILSDENKSAKIRSWKGGSGSVRKVDRKIVKIFTFHEAYVDGVEFETSARDSKLNEERNAGYRASKKPENNQMTSSKLMTSCDGYDVRRSMEGISYRVPTLNSKKATREWSASILFVLREIILGDVEQLLWLERKENRAKELK